MSGNLIITLLFDCGLAVLLMVTIRYCAKLSVRIKTLQDSRGELAGMITQFDTATSRAMASVAELQSISKKVIEALQLKIDKANFLADDLAFLIEKSNKLVLQLEQMKLTLKPPEIKPYEMPAAAKAAAKHSVDRVMEALASTGASMDEFGSGNMGTSEARVVPRTGAERELLAALKSNR